MARGEEEGVKKSHKYLTEWDVTLAHIHDGKLLPEIERHTNIQNQIFNTRDEKSIKGIYKGTKRFGMIQFSSSIFTSRLFSKYRAVLNRELRTSRFGKEYDGVILHNHWIKYF